METVADLTFMKSARTKLLVCVADPAMPYSPPLTLTIFTCADGLTLKTHETLSPGGFLWPQDHAQLAHRAGWKCQGADTPAVAFNP